MKKMIKKQTGGNLGNIWTGPIEEHPGILKAKNAKKVRENVVKTAANKKKVQDNAIKVKAAKKAVPKAQLGTIVKTIAGATKGAVRGGKTAYKAAKEAETANLRNIEDWDAYRAAKSDRRLKTAVAAPTAVTLAAMAYDKKNQNNKKKVEANKTKVQANKQKVAANAAKYKKAGGSVKSKKK
jgi:hypothetical protein